MPGDLLGSGDEIRENLIDIEHEVPAVMIQDQAQDLDHTGWAVLLWSRNSSTRGLLAEIL